MNEPPNYAHEFLGDLEHTPAIDERTKPILLFQLEASMVMKMLIIIRRPWRKHLMNHKRV